MNDYKGAVKSSERRTVGDKKGNVSKGMVKVFGKDALETLKLDTDISRKGVKREIVMKL